MNRVGRIKVDAFERTVAGISRIYYFVLGLFFLFISIRTFVESGGTNLWAWGALALSIVLFVIPLLASDKAMIDGGPNP